MNKFHKMYDEQCKKILSYKSILSHIIKGCVEEFKDIPVQNIASYIEDGDTTKPKIVGLDKENIFVPNAKINFDLLFTITLPNSKEQVPIIINLEPQNNFHPGHSLVTRGLYHAIRLCDTQKNNEPGFQHSNFNDLKKVYSIWVCIQPPKKYQGMISRYHIKESLDVGTASMPKRVYDLFSVVMLYVNDELNTSYDTLLTMLHILLVSKLQVDTKIQVLQHDYGIIMSKEEENEVNRMSDLWKVPYNEGMEQGIALGMKQGLEQGIHQGIEQGIEQGIHQGIEQGIEQGIHQGIKQGAESTLLRCIQNLCKQYHITALQAMDSLGIDEEDRDHLISLLNE